MTQYRTPFFNTFVDNVTLREAIDVIDSFVTADSGHHYVVTPNVDHIVKLQKDKEFLKLYNRADLILTDGVPLMWAAKFFGTPLKEKVSGSDLFPELCKHAAEQNQTMFFLGGLEGVADKAKKELENRYPNLQVVGTYSPPFGFEHDEVENQKIIDMINDLNVDILCVGVGAPKQEKWIYNNREKLNVKVSLGIGASFDFIAGTVVRAPLWMQKVGLEWLDRTIKEPKRMFKRYFIDDMVFFPLMFKYKLKNKAKK